MSELEDPSTLFERLRPLRTDMDSFNLLLDTSVDFLEGHCDLSEVEAQLARVDQDLGRLRLQFEDGLRFQVPGPELDTGAGLVYGAFAGLQQSFERLSRALQAGRAVEAARQLEASNALVNQLFWAFQQLRELLGREEKFSESPFIQELIRVGRACLSGALAPELFQERFEAFCQFHDQFVESLQPLLQEVQGDPRHPQLLEALEEQNGVLDDLAAFFQSGDESQLKDALDRLARSSAVLLELQHQFLQEEGGEPGLFCFRCNHANAHGESVCKNCGARLFANQMAVEGGTYNDPTLPGNLQKLLTAGENYRNHTIDQSEFLEVLDWYDGLADAALQQMSELATPSRQADSMSDLQRTLYAEAVETMQHGLEALKSGVERLRQFADKLDPVDLEFGVENCRAGHQHMLRFAEINQELMNQAL